MLDLRFPRLRAVSAVGLTLATMPHAQIKVELTQEDGVVTSFVRDYQDLSGIPDVDLPIPAGPLQTQRLRIEIMDLAPRPGDGPHIHVRELRVR